MNAEGDHATLEIGLSIGTNLGDRLANLLRARDEIGAIPGVETIDIAPIYETEPVDVDEEFSGLLFLNTLLLVATSLEASHLAARLHVIEEQFGRDRKGGNNTPRVIDIDMIYAGDRRRSGEGLVLPHPRWHERRFVVQPLADVRPDLIVPGQDRTVAAVLAALPEAPRVRVFARDW